MPRCKQHLTRTDDNLSAVIAPGALGQRVAAVRERPPQRKREWRPSAAGVLVLLACLGTAASAQDGRDAPPSADTAVVEPTTRFLRTWLVDRDVESAAASFAAAAFTHGELLAEDCLGLQSTNQMGRVREFLGAMNTRPVRVLGDALSTDAAGMLLDAPLPALNDVRRDGFAIYRVAKMSLVPDELPGPALNALLPPVFYLQVVPLRESFFVFFMWIPDSGSYRILTADVMCQ